MVFVNPQLPADRLIDTYEDRGDPEALIAWYARVTDAAKLAEFDKILSTLEAAYPKKGRLLDFGCGPGYFLEGAARRGWEAHGVELGSWALEAARRRRVVNVHQGTLATQRFRDGWFDVACAQQVLEHLPTPRTDLKEIHRVLCPGGIFYANVPNYRCLSILLGRDDFELNWPMDHVNYFTARTLRHLLQSCGFRVLWTSTFGGVKWENILGRSTQSAEACAWRGEVAAGGPAPFTANGAGPAPRPPLIKRLLLPLVRKVFYQWAQVAINLEVLAQKA
jgi:SAM-dependent methyltransferase